MGKRLGQHFLKDKKILARIAREALSCSTPHSLHPPPCIIEIGPGHGELTDALTAAGAKRVIAIEKDRALTAQLRAKYAKNQTVEIVEGDVRNVLPALAKNSKLKTRNYIVVGNIPYYLTGYLFRLVGELMTHDSKLMTKIVLLVQKEVAERVVAKAPRANLLGSMVQGWARPRIAFTVPRGAFAPSPKIDSALLVLEPFAERTRNADIRYYGIAKKAFAHPRKTLANNLREGFSLTKASAETLVRTLGLKENARAAELTPEHIKTLVKMMYN